MKRIIRWDEVCRAQLRDELDTYLARIYGLTRDETPYRKGAMT